MKYRLRNETPKERFERLESIYRHHYKRTNGHDVKKLEYKKGWVNINDNISLRLNDFSAAIDVLICRPNYSPVQQPESPVPVQPDRDGDYPGMDWDLYPGNEAGAFDYLDQQAEERRTFDQIEPPVKDKAVQDEGWHRIKDFGSSRILKGERNVCSMYSESEEFAPLMEQAENMYYALKDFVEFMDKGTATGRLKNPVYYEAKAIINRIESQSK